MYAFSCLCPYKFGFSALNIAAREGHAPILRLLLDKGAAIETKNNVRKRYIHRKTQRRPSLSRSILFLYELNI